MTEARQLPLMPVVKHEPRAGAWCGCGKHFTSYGRPSWRKLNDHILNERRKSKE